MGTHKRTWIVVAVLGACVFAGVLGARGAFGISLPKWFSFEKKDALNEWEEKIFKGRVIYSVKTDKSQGYLTAYSESAASGIFYRISFDPKQEPLVSWKWKVMQFPEKRDGVANGQGQWIEKDDYAARFYVIFPRFNFYKTKSLEYVWDKNLPAGTIMTSPYFRNIKIFVIESGEARRGEWVSEKRNVYEDFQKAFGSEPPLVGAVAIMTDTDNSLSTAEAYYDELKVGYADGSEPQ
jgi:hypothetical protein